MLHNCQDVSNYEFNPCTRGPQDPGLVAGYYWPKRAKRLSMDDFSYPVPAHLELLSVPGMVANQPTQSLQEALDEFWFPGRPLPREIDDRGLTLESAHIDETPKTAVEAAVPIIAHAEIAVRRDHHRAVIIPVRLIGRDKFVGVLEDGLGC